MSLEQENKELKEKVKKYEEALRYYARGGEPTKEHPYIEFGCGCCVQKVEIDENGEYDFPWNKARSNECRGLMARKALGIK